jgi:hypothetical protein
MTRKSLLIIGGAIGTLLLALFVAYVLPALMWGAISERIPPPDDPPSSQPTEGEFVKP